MLQSSKNNLLLLLWPMLLMPLLLQQMETTGHEQAAMMLKLLEQMTLLIWRTCWMMLSRVTSSTAETVTYSDLEDFEQFYEVY